MHIWWSVQPELQFYFYRIDFYFNAAIAVIDGNSRSWRFHSAQQVGSKRIPSAEETDVLGRAALEFIDGPS